MISRFIVLYVVVASFCGYSFNLFRSNKLYSNRIARCQATMEETSAPSSSKPKKAFVSKDKDLSKFTVGQKLSGKVVNVKQFGVFVKLSQGVDALLPRSTLSSSQYAKLKKFLDTNSTENVNIELLTIDTAKQTLSAKYIPADGEVSVDISKIDPKVLKTQVFDAEVVSAHDFGVFARIVDSESDGLIPASMLADRSSIQKNYPIGMKLQVKVHEFNAETNKLTLTMKSSSSQDVSVLSGIPHDKWIQGVVQKVINFGLIVRPAGYDVTGMVHQSQIPRALTAALKKRVTTTPVPGQNKSDVEMLFQEGDVIKMRVQSFNTDANKIELTMQPYMQSEDEDDDYIVEGRETDEEAEEAEREARDNEDDSTTHYDPESLLLWWKGAAYHKEEASAAVVDEELAVVNESEDIVEGTWRRLFEIDMREDEADFSSKANELEAKELEEEIGELAGLDDEIVDNVMNSSRHKMGAFINLAGLPAEWKTQLEFVKELESEESTKIGKLRSGKKGEDIELGQLVLKMEQDAQRAMQMRQSRSAAPRQEEAPTQAAPAPVAAAPVE